jgi:hypothetical protein
MTAKRVYFGTSFFVTFFAEKKVKGIEKTIIDSENFPLYMVNESIFASAFHQMTI